MFLKSVELYGFKSFADKTRLEFSDGTTSLLGPNGCGKSNIVDAIKWVLGEQSTKTLRASKMEDVIFNGTDNRKPLNVAEVTLTINNEQRLLPTEHTEVEITRRIFRSGESEFFINRTQCRLRDIRELFYDTGVGKSAYSILEQGKIDQILSTRPEDRRYIFEEAAGITRYKSKTIEAQEKLERTQENIEQVETILIEVKRQYDSRKSQATKAAKYKELEEEMLSIEIDANLSTVQALLLLKESKQHDLDKAQNDYQSLTDEIKASGQVLEEHQELMRQQSERRISVQNRIQRLEEQQNSKKQQLKLVQQRYQDALRSHDEAIERAAKIRERIERDSLETEQQKDRLEQARDQIAISKQQLEANENESKRTSQLIADHEHEIEEREKKIIELEGSMRSLSLRLQTITDTIVAELDEKLKQSGYTTKERQKAERLLLEALSRATSVIDTQLTYATSIASIRRQSTDKSDYDRQWVKILTDIRSLTNDIESRFESFRSTIPSFIDDLLAPEGIITQKHVIDSEMVTIRNRMDTERRAIAALREDNRGLTVLLNQVAERNIQLNAILADYSMKANTAKALIENIARTIDEQRFLEDDVLRDAENASKRAKQCTQEMELITEDQHDIAREYDEMQSTLETVIESIDRQNKLLSEEREAMNLRYEKLHAIRSEIDKFMFHIENLTQQIQGVYGTFFEHYGRSLKEYEHRLEDTLEDSKILRERLTQIKKQIQQMGYINHMAQEEFAEVKERYEFLTKQISDLVKAKNDLTRIIDEIRIRSEHLFIDSYQKIRISFQEMFHRMFGGGRAELRLLDPENVLESGIDILAQPPGKKLDRLAPLSGGEKSLTAVALLFATYKVKPSPFCILDEIDAALDDRNIGFFLDVLEDFSKESQFIIITHNKRTVLGSKTLLGVTMQEHGISKAISWRMGWEADKDTIFTEQVDIPSDNTV
ncbi:MAG: AAA family ATPase [Sphaerochaetaceae bacterium]|nr:AAA family ATPase [Sphaerochaetaceae bacterium]